MSQGRIVLDARYLRGEPGGVAAYTEALVEHIPALLPDLPIVFLRHSDAASPLSRAPNVTEWSLGGEPNSPWTYLRMGRWLNTRLNPNDLFHAPYRILPRGLRTRSVITVHDVMQVVCPRLVFPNPIVRACAKPYWSLAIRSALREAGRIIAVSQYSGEDAVRVNASCAPRLRVVPLGKSSAFHSMDKVEAERLSAAIIPRGKRFFLVLGGGYPNKNHGAAVSAFAKGFQHSDDIDLLIIQRNRTFPPELRSVIRNSKLETRIRVRSGVGTDELVALYNRAEALVFPSLYEGFGLPVLEAMACGCPVLCSNVTSLPEVAGDAALFFEPEDAEAISRAMRRVVADQGLRQSLAQRGLRQAARFSWRKMALETIRVYREIGSSIPAPPSLPQDSV